MYLGAQNHRQNKYHFEMSYEILNQSPLWKRVADKEKEAFIIFIIFTGQYLSCVLAKRFRSSHRPIEKLDVITYLL